MSWSTSRSRSDVSANIGRRRYLAVAAVAAVCSAGLATADVDNCPDGFSPDENIAFGDADSGVPNYDQGDGCTFLDVVWAEEPFANHGAFVEVVEATAEAWYAAGLLTDREVGMVIAAAARSGTSREGAPSSG